jgi:hypothetical protein
MTDTKLKYAFAETPEEVIRERHVYLIGRGLNATDMLTTVSVHGEWLVDIGHSDLLTVLDALADSALSVPWPVPARQLRIDILAALGIEEA